MTYPAVSADGGFEVKSIGKTTGTASIITTTTTDDARVHMGFKSLCITNSGAGYVKQASRRARPTPCHATLKLFHNVE